MTNNKKLTQIISKVVIEEVRNKKGKKAGSTLVGSRETNMPTKVLPSFSF